MARRRERELRVFVLGAGKLGTGLARSLRAAGGTATLRGARRELPTTIDADVVVLAVRDRDLRPLAVRLVGVVSKSSVVVHVAGALGAAPLDPLRGTCAGVGQMHPMISFASTRYCPGLARGNVQIQGDPAAVGRARRLAHLLGMTPRTFVGLDAVAYHASAGLVANGAAALAGVGAELLARAGVPVSVAPKMLGPLLRSVADNVEKLGLPDALTGPVRRGDASGIDRHLAVLRAKLPEAVALYVATAYAQLPLARAIGEASPERLDAVREVLDAATAAMTRA